MDLRQRLEQLTAKRASQPTPNTPNVPDTAERLKRMLDHSARPASVSKPDEQDIAARLGGVLIAPGVILIEMWLPLDYRHGRIALFELLDAPISVLTGPEARLADLLFLDTETTGLAGGTGTLPFLLGLARLEDRGLRLRQYLLTGFAGEQAMLEHARDWLTTAGQLVTYNGKSFDVPLMVTRHRLRRVPCSLEGKPHTDLVHPTRTAFASLWADCRLQRAETELLGLVRQDDLPGAQVPQVWSAFVRDRRLGQVPRILEHNKLDVITLAGLLSEMSRIHAIPGYGDADAHAVARRHLRTGHRGMALDHLDASQDSLDLAGLLDLARLHRQGKRWDDALAIWQPLASKGVSEAILALAKYYEHVAQDYDRALSVCCELAVLQPNDVECAKRFARIHRKRGERLPGLAI